MKVNLKKFVRMTATGAALGLLCLIFSTRGWGQGKQGMSGAMGQQIPSNGMPQTPSSKGGIMQPGADPNGDPTMANMEAQRDKMRNADRQKQLKLDTDRLLSLATELKQQVDKTDQNILSVDVIKKADEIEKLAKSVRDRMKG